MKNKLVGIILLSTNLLISRPPELPNFGNTCYLNATLQALYSLEPFVNTLRNKENLFNKNTFAGEYVSLITNFSNPMQFKPGTDISYLQSFAEINDAVMQQTAGCGAGAQNDSQEFLTTLLDEFQNKDNFIEPTNEESLNLMTSIGDFFSYIQTKIIKCPQTASLPEINNEIIKNEFSPIISVEIPQQNNPLIFEELLAAFFLPEQLETFRSYPPNSCSKQLVLNSAPEILIVHTKRIQFNRETYQPFKITTPVDVPEIVNLIPITGHNEEYQLTAAIIHEGTAHGGHYVAYARDSEENKWYYCNDNVAIIGPLNFSEALKPSQRISTYAGNKITFSLSGIEQGYMFFFQKRRSQTLQPLADAGQPTPTRSNRPLPTPPQKTTSIQKALGNLATELNNLAAKINNPQPQSSSWWKTMLKPLTAPWSLKMPVD